MLYLVSDASRPVSFSAAGNLTNDDQFLHPKRTQDSYELISVIKGVLHIQSGTQSYHLAPASSSSCFRANAISVRSHPRGSFPFTGRTFISAPKTPPYTMNSRPPLSYMIPPAISFPRPVLSPQTARSIFSLYSCSTFQSGSATFPPCSAAMPRVPCCSS